MPRVLSPKERYWILGMALAILILVISLPFNIFYHRTIPAPDFGGSYTEGLLGEPKFINPLLVQTNDTDRDLSRLIYAGLMKYDKQGNLVPDLAESYDVSSDGLEYTFVLKKDLRWHDGFPLTATDIIFTIKILQNNDYGSIQRINWQGVEAEKGNDRIVKLKLKSRYAQFLNNTTLGILPKHLWENIKPTSFHLSDLNLRPIGSGPYRFKRLRKDERGSVVSYDLKAFEQYYSGKPFIKNLTFKFYRSEEELVNAYNRNNVEGLGLASPNQLKKIKFSSRLKTEKIKLPRYFAAFFNPNQSKLLSDKNIRLALNYATDKAALVKEVLNGYGLAVNSPILKELTASTPVKYAHDQEFAKQILDNSGWKDADQNGVREKDKDTLTLKITTSNWPELSQTADLLKKQWETVGFKVEVQVEPLAEIQQDIKERNYEILVFGEVLNLDPDPFSFWHSSQKKDPGLNLALYDNKNADKLLEESRQILNSLERNKKYEDFEKILLEDAPAVFLYSPHYLYLPSKKIKGNDLEILSTPASRFDNISQWYIETRRIGKETK